MRIGTIVRRAETIDPRIGIVQEVKSPSKPRHKTLCLVLWNSGDTGHYFDTCLEVICE